METTPRKPNRLRQLHWSTWRGVLWRSVTGFVDDDCSDWAAALTYYAVLALFPGAIVVVSLVSLAADGSQAVSTILGVTEDLLPASLMQGVREPIEKLLTENDSAGVLLSFGALGAIWSTSGYVGAFIRASNAIYRVREGRPWYVLRPLQIGLTILALVLLAVLALGLLVSGPVARAVGDALRLGEVPRELWQIGRWPVLVVAAAILLSLLFWIAPNVEQPRFRWVTVGGAFALFAWLAVSAGFGGYVANFGSYDVTYGSLGAVVVFLVWLYLSNCALMLAVELNAELARARSLQAGDASARYGPALPPRATRTERPGAPARSAHDDSAEDGEMADGAGTRR